MKFLSLLFLTLIVSGCSLTTEQQKLIGQNKPNARYFLLDQSTHALSEKIGKTTVVAFWDASCLHCLKTMPQVNSLAKKFHANSNVDFLAISINLQSEEELLKSRIKQLGLDSVEHAFSGNDVYDECFLAFQGDSVPYLVLLDQKGSINWIGNDAQELEKKLVEILKETK